MNNIAGALYRVIKIKNEKRNEMKCDIPACKEIVNTYSLGRSDLFSGDYINEEIKLVIFADSHCNVVPLQHAVHSNISTIINICHSRYSYKANM